jgi:hypothetical protein
MYGPHFIYEDGTHSTWLKDCVILEENNHGINVWKKSLGNKQLPLSKLCPSKSHYPTTRAQKTIRMQLLCNYPLGITTTM